MKILPEMLPFDCAQGKLGGRVLETDEFNHLLSMTTPAKGLFS